MIKLIKKVLKIYLFVYKEIKKSSSLLLWSLLITTSVTGIIPVITKYIMKFMVFQLEKGLSFDNFIISAGIYVMALFFRSIFSNFREYINSISTRKFVYGIQNKLIEKINKIEYKTFYSPDYQDNYSTVFQNSQFEASELMFTTIQLFSLAVQLIVISVIIMSFSSIILIFLIVGALPTLLLNIKNEKERVTVTEESVLFYRKNFYYFNLFTYIPSIKDIKVFNLKRFITNNRRFTFHDYLSKWKKFYNNELLKKICSDVLLCFCVWGSILLVVFELIQKKQSISSFVFFVGMIVSFKDIADTFMSTVSRNYKCIAFANKLIIFLNDDNELKSGNKRISVSDKLTLEFKSVYFKYPYSETYALQNVSFTISIGEKIALVGKNGCGKTTIINLILRLYDPTEGEILLDGINIKDYDYQEYLKLFSVVFQDYQSYSFGLLDYISSGNSKNPDNLLKMKQAAVMTTANKFIEKTPENWESNLTTRFDKDGLELSGGQWQKLALARAFYSDAPILILDEPTSAMDAVSESHVYESVKNIGKHKTAIFISHRMYASKIATKIIYIEKGLIKNIGTHNELMMMSTGYQKLFKEQADKYDISVVKSN